MKFNKFKIVTLSAVTVLFLVACSNKETFVINKKNLDELTIDSYIPLEVPPIYYLSSQEIADERRFLRQSAQSVRNVFFNSVIAKDNNNQIITDDSAYKFSNGDVEFLKLAGANKEYNNVRDQIDEESLGVIKLDDGTLLKINANSKIEGLPDKFNEYKRLNKK